jgi:hypothetical protein
LADFIRSTGPSGGSIVRTVTAPSTVAKLSVDTPRVSTTSSINRSRLLARDAAVDYKDDNSDLIDFIRRGPPSVGGNPRIPRTVAPFRTTMDSDQLTGAVGGRAVDAQLRDVDVRTSQASTNITESSMQSSANSQSALLGRNKPLPGGNRGYGIPGDDDMPMPKRKTRRVRDPYAIDLSDDDEDDDDMMAPGPQRRAPPQEESLLDFLKNMPPPPPEPVAAQPSSRPPKKKASAPSLMARLTRRGESGRNSNSSSGNSSPRSPVPPQAADARNLTSRASAGKGYIPIQVNMPPGADKYNPSNFRSTAPGVGEAPAPTRRVPMKKFEPREAVAVSSRGTSELAEFFKNSAPPGGVVGPRDDPNYPPRYPNRKKTSIAG